MRERVAVAAVRRRLGGILRRPRLLAPVVSALALAAVPASALATSKVVDWGTNGTNNLDVGWISSNEPTPYLAQDIPAGATQVVGGWHTNFAIMSDGTVRAWGGSNDFGELGDGTQEEKETPVQVHKLEHIVSLSGGGYHFIALSEFEGASSVWVWGDANAGTNGNGTSGPGHAPKEPIEVAVPGHVIAVQAGGSVDFAISEMEGTNVLWSWGGDKSKGLGIAEAPDECEEGGGSERSVPCATEPVRVTIPGLPEGWKITQVSGGLASQSEVQSIYALATNPENPTEKKIYSWGKNTHGSLGNGTATESALPVEVKMAHVETEEKEQLHVLTPIPIKSIVGGSGYGLALLEDGHVIGWGGDKAGQLGPSTAEVCGESPASCECKKLANSCDKYPQLVAGIEEVVELDTGGSFNLARTAEGAAYGWGVNGKYGQLGIGIEEGPEACSFEEVEGVVEASYCARTPTRLPTIEDVEAISASFTGGLAILPESLVPKPAISVTPEENKMTVNWNTPPLPPEGKYEIQWAPYNPETKKSGNQSPAKVQTTSCSLSAECHQATTELEHRPYEIIVNTMEKIAPGTEKSSYHLQESRKIIATPLTPTVEVTGISPATGPEAGGNEVTITGAKFEEGATVAFNGKAATSVTFVSASTLKATVPSNAGNGGETIEVRVTEPAGKSPISPPGDQYTYIAAPKVKKVEPIRSPASGGQIITIVGTNMEGISEVVFGTTPAAEIVAGSNTSTSIEVKTPPLAPGNWDIHVTTPGGKSETSSGDTYKAAPSITSVSPNHGPAAGGTHVTVTGYGLASATFKIAGNKMTSVICGPGGTVCEMSTPAHAAGGPFHITAKAATIESIETEADLYKYE